MEWKQSGVCVSGASPGENTRVSSHSLLQGVFPTQGSNPGLLHFRQILYCLKQGWPQDLKTSVFIPIPKQGNPKECTNYCTIAHISHARKVMLKILQARLQQYVNCELPDVQAGFRKGRGTRDQIANIRWIIKKAKTFVSALLTTPKPLTVWITANWKILKEMGIPDHLNCLLRKLYAGQEATVRTGHGTTDWSQIGKGVCQG